MIIFRNIQIFELTATLNGTNFYFELSNDVINLWG